MKCWRDQGPRLLSVLHLWPGRWYKRPSCRWSIPRKETENRFHHKSGVTCNLHEWCRQFFTRCDVGLGRPESERPCVASFRAGRWTIKRETQCTRPLPNCSHPPSTQCPATTPFLPLSPRGPTGRAANACDASGFFDPPPRLGVDALEAVRSAARPARSAGVYLQSPWLLCGTSGVFKCS